MGTFKHLIVRMGQMRKEHLIVSGHNRDGDVEYSISEDMPAWMQRTLALGGINRKFTVKRLTKDQWGLIDVVCELSEMEKKGEVTITYNPEVDEEPIVNLTDKAHQTYKKDLDKFNGRKFKP
jgi:hypothetical protein